jgi:hypothetical protein
VPVPTTSRFSVSLPEIVEKGYILNGIHSSVESRYALKPGKGRPRYGMMAEKDRVETVYFATPNLPFSSAPIPRPFSCGSGRIAEPFKILRKYPRNSAAS